MSYANVEQPEAEQEPAIPGICAYGQSQIGWLV